MYSIDDYDFNVFDQTKKYHLHIDADTLIMAESSQPMLQAMSLVQMTQIQTQVSLP